MGMQCNFEIHRHNKPKTARVAVKVLKGSRSPLQPFPETRLTKYFHTRIKNTVLLSDDRFEGP